MKRTTLIAILFASALAAGSQEIDMIGTWDVEYVQNTFGYVGGLELAKAGVDGHSTEDWVETAPVDPADADPFESRIVFRGDGTGVEISKEDRSTFSWLLEGSSLKLGYQESSEEFVIVPLSPSLYLATITESDEVTLHAATFVFRKSGSS